MTSPRESVSVRVITGGSSAASARSGYAALRVLTETDDVWLDYWNDVVPNDLEWIDKGSAFLWSSERNGWRHIYRVSKDGANVTPVTKGNLDVERVNGVDEAH